MKFDFFFTIQFIPLFSSKYRSHRAVETFVDLQSISRGLDPGVKMLNSCGTHFDAPDAHFDKLCLFSDAHAEKI
jgi:hypothetical protein